MGYGGGGRRGAAEGGRARTRNRVRERKGPPPLGRSGVPRTNGWERLQRLTRKSRLVAWCAGMLFGQTPRVHVHCHKFLHVKCYTRKSLPVSACPTEILSLWLLGIRLWQSKSCARRLLSHLGYQQNFWIFWPPLIRICNWFVEWNSRNLPYYVRFSMTPLPLWCRHHIWTLPYCVHACQEQSWLARAIA